MAKKINAEELRELVIDMYWEFDRLSSSGQLTLEKIAKLIGVPTEEEMNAIPIEQHLENL
jgi:predicted HTH domain antitoxin